MAKFFDGKVTPNSPQNQDPDRYQNLGLQEVEPNLGVPDEDGYMLISDTLGNRGWVPTGLGPTAPFIPKNVVNAKGDIIIGSGPETPTTLPVAPDGCVLLSDSNEFVGVRWVDFPELGIPLSLFDAKGSILVAISPGNASLLDVGLDGQVLVADSNEELGVRWKTASVSGISESVIQNRGDIIVGQLPNTANSLSVGNDGDILTADYASPLGVKWAPAISKPSDIETISFETEILGAGAYQDFWMDLGLMYSFLSVDVTSGSKNGWLRLYTTETGASNDTRIVPGPPFPLSSSGFVTEIVTSPSYPKVNFIPVQSIYTEGGSFFRFLNQESTSQKFTLEFKIFRQIPDDCDSPPYGNDVYLSTYCVKYFNIITGSLLGSTPNLVYSGGSTLLWQANLTYTGNVVGGSGSLGEFSLSRNGAGDISSISLSSGTGYIEGDTVTILGSLIGGIDGVEDVTISLGRDNGLELLGAWQNGSSIVSLPPLNLKNGLNFKQAWKDCTNLAYFPANMFDNSVALNFSEAWRNCALGQSSVDNILVSLDAAGQVGGIVDLSGGTSAAPGVAGSAAKLSLQGKGWIVTTN